MGPIDKQPSDPENLEIIGLRLDSAYDKYSYLKRYFQDLQYAAKCLTAIRSYRPDVVISAGAGPWIQAALVKGCRKDGIPFVAWIQDFYGIAIGNVLSRRWGFPGSVAGAYFNRVEQRFMELSNHVVFIADDFEKAVPPRIGTPGHSTVIENWATLRDLPLRPKVNEWSLAHGLQDSVVFLYAGTLGLKHNPSMLAELAAATQESRVKVVVVTEGLGRKVLEEQKGAHNLQNLLLFDFQPYEKLPDMLASADVLVAILEADAGAYSVPGKILSYLCSGRPLLGAIPKENLAARIITGSGAGIVVDPNSTENFIREAIVLSGDPGLRRSLGLRARQHAESHFNIEAITDQFERVFTACIPHSTHAFAEAAPSSPGRTP
jgi:glycosyltransferase involved in cell wall biosynthesis